MKLYNENAEAVSKSASMRAREVKILYWLARIMYLPP